VLSVPHDFGKRNRNFGNLTELTRRTDYDVKIANVATEGCQPVQRNVANADVVVMGWRSGAALDSRTKAQMTR